MRCEKGRPLGFALTPGQTHDTQAFAPLLRMISDRIEAVLADKGYDADAIRDEIAGVKVEAVIPSKSNRGKPIPHDKAKYKWRNQIERPFNKPKNWRRVVTRYDKSKESYLGFVAIAAAKLWIPFVHER
ncbi:IS5 family transposase [Xanthobacteraceae bacterium Astr-EGSB]|nr:IS5 family transposase [Xanthobacteraceae bacterium Astr-EGSB]